MGKGEGGTNWESGTDTYTPCVRQRAAGAAVYRRELRPVVCDDQSCGVGGQNRTVLEAGEVCMPMADSYRYVAEANTKT